MADHLHAGHRARVKQKYIENGLAPFASHEIVELLLFFGIPQRDVNPLAHRLLAYFGTVRDILCANREVLLQIEGMTENAATLLALVGDIRRYCAEEEFPKDTILNTTELLVKCLYPRFEGLSEEAVWMLSLDRINRVLAAHMVARGLPNMAEIGVRTVVRYALGDNAMKVVLAHNHPSGIAIPSLDDLHTTAMLARVLKGIGVQLSDHLIFAKNGDCVSINDTASLRPYLEGVSESRHIKR